MNNDEPEYRRDYPASDRGLVSNLLRDQVLGDCWDGADEGDTRDEESLEDHNIQGLGAFRDVFDAGGEQ